MGVPLKGLLGKTKRAIVVNGQLLRVGRHQIVASLSNYRAEYSLAGSSETLTEAKFTTITLNRLRGFDEKYAVMRDYDYHQVDEKSDEEAWTQHEIYVDSYTGAIIIESPVYKTLISPHMHEIGVQHTPQVAEAVLKFVVEYTSNYMDLYMYLFNKRITSPYSSIATRCHFVAGFFQPLMAESQGIQSPFGFGQNKWFYDLFADNEKFLERPYDSPRKLNLSCVAMCDIAHTFDAKVITEMERGKWMLMCLTVLLNQLDMPTALALTKSYGTLFQAIRDDQDSIALFSNMMIRADKMRKAVSTT